jgi:hypothetical protein
MKIPPCCLNYPVDKMANRIYELDLISWPINLTDKEFRNTIMGKLANKGWHGRCVACVSDYEIAIIAKYIEQLSADAYKTPVSSMDECYDDRWYTTKSFCVFFKNAKDHDYFVDELLPSIPKRTCWIEMPKEEFKVRNIKNRSTLNHMIIKHEEDDTVILHTEPRNDLVALKLRWS